MSIDDHLPDGMKDDVRKCISKITDISIPVGQHNFRVCKYWVTPEQYKERGETAEFICPYLGKPILMTDNNYFFVCRRSTDMKDYHNGNGDGHKENK